MPDVFQQCREVRDRSELDHPQASLATADDRSFKTPRKVDALTHSQLPARSDQGLPAIRFFRDSLQQKDLDNARNL